ncbi:hypothetical protein B0O99DRAFT_620157 [Bisporella sp. PMI_857]|nr:hypothetical protein B0O99DRAFT_620157 [Bisporella sp. PMI_857]
MLATNTPGPSSLQNLILGDSPATISDTTAISAPAAACLSHSKRNQPAGISDQIAQMLAFNASLKTASLHGVNHTRPELRSSKYPGKNSNIFSKVKKAVSSRLPGFIVKGQFKDDQHLDSSSTQYQCRDENQDVYVMDIDRRISEGDNLSGVMGKAKSVMDNGFITRDEIADEGQSIQSQKSLSDIRSLRSKQSSHEPQDSDGSYPSSTESPYGGMRSGAYRRYGVGGPAIPPLPGSVQYLEEEYQTRAYNQRPLDAGNNDSFISSSPDAQSTPTRSRLEPIERDGRRVLTRVPTGSPSFLDPRSSKINHLSDIEVDRPFRYLKLSGHPKYHPKRKSSKEIEGNPFIGEVEKDGHKQKKQYRTLYTDKQKTNMALKRYETDLEMVFPGNPLTTKDKNQKRKARVFDNKYFNPSKFGSKPTGKKTRDDRGTCLRAQDESSAMDIDELQMDHTALMN